MKWKIILPAALLLAVGTLITGGCTPTTLTTTTATPTMTSTATPASTSAPITGPAGTVTPTPGLTVTPVQTNVTPEPTPATTPAPTIPPVSPTPSAVPFLPVTFDFDSGIPVIGPGTTIPFSQTTGGVTAQFTSLAASSFSIQNPDSTFLKLSQFFGNYLNDNDAFMNTLEIRFSQPVKNIKLTFATVDYHGPGEVETPTSLKLTAYLDSNGKTTVGMAATRGVLADDSYPQGTLSFDAGQQSFNVVTLELVPQANGATYFMVDNITVSS